MEDHLISIGDYLEKNLPFKIPYYQRGYIWGKSRGTEKDSVTFMMESIIDAFKNKKPLFLQGVTVCEYDKFIELIDGQQRTTFLYLLLKIYLGYEGKFDIQYTIRNKAQDFLSSIKGKSSDEIFNMCEEDENEELQDNYYFKKTIRIISEQTKDIDKSALKTFVLDKVKFLYINIEKEKALDIFTMMNGNKAIMKTEEIIKAEMLRLVSIDDNSKNDESIRWEQNMLRSRYAREWDKWLYWWNREDVQTFYHTQNIMGWLIEIYFDSKTSDTFNFENFRDKKTSDTFNFENFRDKILKGDELNAKNTFYELKKIKKIGRGYLSASPANKVKGVVIGGRITEKIS